jgi:hypothetical protein
MYCNINRCELVGFKEVPMRQEMQQLMLEKGGEI